jgi:hypothetical protein
MDDSEHFHQGVVSVYLTKESVEAVIQIVKQFDGYNSVQLKEILLKVGKCQEIQVDEDVYF